MPEPAKENEIDITVHGSVEEEAVKRWCEERLASYKQPGRITIVA